MTASLVNVENHTVVTDSAPPASEPAASFHLSPRVILAIVLATILLSAAAIMILATIAPQGFAAGS